MSVEVRTEPLGGSPLAVAAQRGDLPSDWFVPRPAGVEQWRSRARSIGAEFGGRPWLSALRPALEPRGFAAERLERTAASGGVLVTTGQQPGLFGGPVLTLAKALTALALADDLERATGIRVAPVFWAATDDADFAEASVARVVVDADVNTLAIDSPAPAGTPMSLVPLRGVAPLLDRLLAASGSAPDARTVAAVSDAFQDGRTVGDAYVSLLRALLEPLGIAVLDAAHPCVRVAGSALLRRAFEEAKVLASAIRERDAALRDAGFAPQVEDVDGLSLVFGWEGGVKRRLRIGEHSSRGGGVDELSSTVLLRPVMERAILPTVAYVGGPAELSYFAQATAVAAALGSPAPLAVPRWSTTIVEPRVARIIERLGIDPVAVKEPGVVESVLARQRIPEASRNALAELRDALERGIREIREANSGLLSDSAIEGARRSVLHRIARLERRHAAAVRRQESQLMHDVAVLRAALFPAGGRQERSLSYMPFLIRHGPTLIEEMLRQARAHAERTVSPPPQTGDVAAGSRPALSRHG